jgi:hypothetical protein
MSEFASEGSQAADEEYEHIHGQPDDEPYAATSADGQAEDAQEPLGGADDRRGGTAQ